MVGVRRSRASGYRGPEEVAGFFDNLLDHFERIRVTPERFIEAGDAVVVVGSAPEVSKGGVCP